MVDKEKITQDIKSRKYTQGEIASRNNCSITTVTRIAKSENISPGQGVKNYWEFTEMSKELAYIIGTYLTDGFVQRQYKKTNIRQIGLNCVDIEFADYFEYCINSIGLKCTRGTKPPKSEKHKLQYTVSCYSSMFSQWIYDVTQGKDIIPDVIFNSSKECIMEFLAAIIDGDGNVGKDGSITLSNTQKFILQLEDLLKIVEIRTNGARMNEILESGKEFYRIGIRREDFRNNGGFCKIPRKQHNVENGKEERTWRRPKRYTYVCPVCGKQIMKRKNAKMCGKCYHNSEELKERMKNQASKAGIAANKVRWG